MTEININQAFALLQEMKEEGEQGVFCAEFTKKDGSERQMTCRFGVRSYLKGGEWADGKAGRPEDHWLAIVFDMGKVGYRSIPLKRLHRLCIKGQEYQVNA